MLRGGTIIVVSSRLDPVLGRSGDRRAASSQDGFLGYAQGQPASTKFEDDLLGRATESSSLFGQPSWWAPRLHACIQRFTNCRHLCISR